MPIRGRYDSAYKRLLIMPRVIHTIWDDLIKNGSDGSIDGTPTREVIGATFVLRDISDKIITDRVIRINLAASIATTVFWLTPNIEYVNIPASIWQPGPANNTYFPRTPPSAIPKNAGTVIIAAANQLMYNPTSIQKITLSGFTKDWVVTLAIRDDKLITGVVSDGPMDIIGDMLFDLYPLATIANVISNLIKKVPGDLYFHSPLAYMTQDDFSMAKRLERKRWPHRGNDVPVFTNSELKEFYFLTAQLNKPEFEIEANKSYWQLTQSRLWFRDMANAMRAHIMRDDLPIASQNALNSISDITMKTVIRTWLVDAGIVRSRASMFVDTDVEFEDI